MTPVGFLRPDRLACDEAPYHLPAVYNPWSDETWCFCGDERWPGQTGTWACVERARLLPWESDHLRGVSLVAHGQEQPTESLGWDTYWLEPHPRPTA